MEATPLSMWGFAIGLLLGQSDDPIVTDRPDFTESSVVVRTGSTQIEAGATFAAEDRGRFLNAPEVLIRSGLSKRLELRLGLPNYHWDTPGGGGLVRGWDDLYLGAKVQLGPLRNGTGVALIPAVFMPVGTKDLRSQEASPELKLVWSRSLAGNRTLSGMLYAASTRVDGTRIYPFQHTVSLGIPLADRTSMFIEHVLDVVEGAGPGQTLHAGVTFQPQPDRQLDFHFGLRLAGPVPELFVAAGYAWRF